MMAEIIRFRPGGTIGSRLVDAPGTSAHEASFGGGGGGSGGMEARIAKLEVAVEHIEHDIQEIKTDVREVRNIDLREIRNEARTDFRWMLGLGIGAVVTLAGLMAKGFHWF